MMDIAIQALRIKYLKSFPWNSLNMIPFSLYPFFRYPSAFVLFCHRSSREHQASLQARVMLDTLALERE